MNGKAPDAFRTISEVADWLGVNTHVLRFWESKFSQVKPVKRAGGRRYYRPSDMELLGGIQKLLHEDGMTIKGVQKILREKGVRTVSAMSKPVHDEDESVAPVETAEEPAAVADIPADPVTEPMEGAPVVPEVAASSEPPVLNVVADAVQDEQPSDTVSDAPEIVPLPEPELDVVPESAPLFAHAEEQASDPALSINEADARDSVAIPVARDMGGPVIAPLPGSDLSLIDALDRLQPQQISPQILAPIFARLVDLRARMDSAG